MVCNLWVQLIRFHILPKLISSNFANGFGNKNPSIHWIIYIARSKDVYNVCFVRDGDFILH